MPKFPEDRFDSIPDDLQRVGAHRAPDKKGRGWIGFGWAALATVVLTVGGLGAVAAIDSSINFDLPFLGGQQEEETPTPTPTPTPDAPPQLDPEVPLTVLNGTPTVGLANRVGDALVAEGWAGAALGIGSRANASTDDIEETVVYYNDHVYESAARALVLSLGAGEIRFSEDFPNSPIVIVVGLDYVPAE